MRFKQFLEELNKNPKLAKPRRFLRPKEKRLRYGASQVADNLHINNGGMGGVNGVSGSVYYK